MCGRFTFIIDINTLEEQFEITNLAELRIENRYNIAPSQEVLAIINDGNRNRAGFLRWGLVPVWAKDPKIGSKMINARAETVDEKPSFKKLLTRRRCIIPADSFYEWKKTADGKKQPIRIQLKSGEPFAFAGLWDRWEENGTIIQTCTIITTKPNELMEPIHNRMPVILEKENEKTWLDRSLTDANVLKNLLVPYPSENMYAYPVSTAVNSPKNEGEKCIAAENG